MNVDIARPERISETLSEPPRAVPVRGSRHNRRLVLALTLTILAGFLLGLGVPVHP